MSGAAKAAVFGALLAILAAAALVAAVMLGIIDTPSQQDVSSVLVIGTAPDENGTALGAFAFLLDRDSGEVTLLDLLRPVTVSGTSAQNAREALPFGGGAGVARALAPQTGDSNLPWVVLPAPTWSDILDDSGGVQVVVPERFSSYTDGRLVLLDPGPQRVSGPEAVTLAGSVEYFGDADETIMLLNGLAGAVSAAVGEGDQLAQLVEAGEARSSLPAGMLPTFP